MPKCVHNNNYRGATTCHILEDNNLHTHRHEDSKYHVTTRHILEDNNLHSHRHEDSKYHVTTRHIQEDNNLRSHRHDDSKYHLATQFHKGKEEQSFFFFSCLFNFLNFSSYQTLEFSDYRGSLVGSVSRVTRLCTLWPGKWVDSQQNWDLCVLTGPGSHLTSYQIATGLSFPVDKATGVFSWPLTIA
jgi:hypothetical protein